MKKTLIPHIALILFLFYGVLLIFGPSNSFIYWKTAIAAKEYGHWFALLALLSFAVLIRKKDASAKLLAGIYLLTGMAFLFPLTTAFIHEERYTQELLNIPPVKPGEELNLVDLPTLITGFDFDETPLEKVDYVRYNTESLSLDFYPPQNAQRPAPWILVVHAGGWDSGSSDQLPFVNQILAKHGYGVAAINYRLAPKHTWPAQGEDVTAAIRFIRRNARRFNVRPDDWAILGRSAGGQLAGVAAYTYKEAPAKGYILLYGPTDLLYSWAHPIGKALDPLALLRNFLGGSPKEKHESFVSASPLFQAGPQSPPTLILHGQMDTLVYPQHGKRLAEKLRSLGVPVAHLNLPWATHGFDYALRGPGGQIATRSILFFLGKVLKTE